MDGYTYRWDDSPTLRGVERQIAALVAAEAYVVCEFVDTVICGPARMRLNG
jgi:hypothetical protein